MVVGRLRSDADADTDTVNADLVIQGESKRASEQERESGGESFNLVSNPWAGVTMAKANMEPMYCSDK